MDINSFLLISKAGSTLFRLETAKSDVDFFALSVPQESISIGQEIESRDEDNNNFFIHRIDTMLNINACASALVVPTYDAAFSGNKGLLSFWRNNSDKLADISPVSTYNSTLDQVSTYVGASIIKSYKVCARLIGMMWCRYYTGDMLSARYLPEKWRERYFSARNGNASVNDVKSWLDEICTPSIKRYFSLEPINYELHNEYCQLINTILEETKND